MGVCEERNPRRTVRFTQASQPNAVSLTHGLNQGGGNRKQHGIPGVPFIQLTSGAADLLRCPSTLWLG